MASHLRNPGVGQMLRVLGCLALAALAVAGVVAIVVRFREGMIVTNLTQHVPWGLWIALYIYFIGLSAGAFLLSSLIYVFGMRQLEAAGPTALLQAFGCMVIALFLIFVDLGHPWRFLNVFLYWNPSSVLAWECLFYTAYIVVILAELFLVLRPRLAELAAEPTAWAPLYRLLALGGRVPDEAWRAKAARWLKVLGLIGIPVAIGVHGGTGAIFAVAKARPNWFSGLFPIIFLVSALASGGGLLTLLMAAFSRLPRDRKYALVRQLAFLTVGFVALDGLMLASEILVTEYGEIVHEEIGWQLVLFGPYWWVFWFIQLGCGLIMPVILLALPATRRSITWLGVAGASVTLGILGTRLNIVIPPLIQPALEGMTSAYVHSRFQWGYFPSLNEWLVGIGVIALGFLAFLTARAVLPLDELEPHAAPQEIGPTRVEGEVSHVV